MASDEASENVVPFPRGGDELAPMSPREQYRLLTALAERLAQALRDQGWVKVAASTEFERGMVHDAALIAGIELDRHVTGHAIQDNAVLVAIDDNNTAPLQQRLGGARPRATADHIFETLPPLAEGS